jgi:signal transduction histidine kinase
VTTKAQPFIRVDLNHVLRGVLSDLEIQIERSGARLEIARLPAIDADPLQMRQLLQNLLSNALKFHRKDARPVVRVRGGISENVCEISVEDEGIGFDEKYGDRLFSVFQKLNGVNEFEGTGIGLAICRRIVERHGGSLTARSPGVGAVFTVRLPARQIPEAEK